MLARLSVNSFHSHMNSGFYAGPRQPLNARAKPTGLARRLLGCLVSIGQWRPGRPGNISLNACFKDALFYPSASISSLYGGGYWRIGDGSLIGASLVCETPDACIEIGKHSFLSPGSFVVAAKKIKIGNNVLIARDVTIQDNDSHSLDWKNRINDVDLTVARFRGVPSKSKDFSLVPAESVEIGDNVWIGMSSIILKGVRIGHRAVIGAGSLVTRDVPDDTLAVGNPARVIKHLGQKS